MPKTKIISHAPRMELDRLYMTDPVVLEQLTEMSARGLSWKEIAKALQVPPTQFYLFVQDTPECALAINQGVALATSEVESALFKRAVGYEYTETRIDPDKGNILTIKQMAPDVNAIKMWLTNRAPEKWSGDASAQVTFNQLNVSAEDKMDAAARAIAGVLEQNAQADKPAEESADPASMAP